MAAIPEDRREGPHTRVAYREGHWIAWVGSAQAGQVDEVDLGISDSQAVAAACQRAREIGRVEGDGMSLADMRDALCRDYQINERNPRTIRRAQLVFAALIRLLGNADVRTITGEHLHEYVAKRMETVSRGTARVEINILKRAFRLYAAYGRLDRVPHFPILRPAAPRKGFLDDDQVEQIVAHLAADVQPLVRFLAWTGWRKQEAMGLTWRGIDFSTGIVRLEPGESKSEDPREFPFRYAPPLEKILRDQRELVSYLERVQHTVIPWVFPRYHGGRIANISQTWDTARQRARLPWAIVHDLRRSAVRRLELAGVPRSIAMKLTGHKTERIYNAYGIVSPADLGLGVKRIAEYVEHNKRQKDGNNKPVAGDNQGKDQVRDGGNGIQAFAWEV